MAGTEVGSLYYDLNIDDKNLKKQLDDADKSVKGFGDKINAYWGSSVDASRKFGLALAGVTAGVVAFGVSSVKSFQESQNVMAQTEAVLKSTGNAAGVTAEQVTKLASALERQTKFADEDIQSAENLLLTFTSITKDIFPDATKIVLDMSAALGQDLKSSSIQVGKALQDPILGVTALRRVGVNFSQAQQDVIAKLVETGHKAEAQKMILKELNTEFGGSAVAAGNTFAGSLAKLSNQFDNIKEAIGGTIAAAIIPFTTSLMNWFDSVGGVEGIMQKLKDVLIKIKPYIPEIAGAIIGMLVPALVAAAISAGSFLLTLAPWAALGVAAALVAKKLGIGMDDLRGAVDKLRVVWEKIVEVAKVVYEWWSKLPEPLQLLISPLAVLVEYLVKIHGNMSTLIQDLKELWQQFTSMTIVQIIGQYITQVLWPAIQALGAAVWQNLLPALKQLWDAVVKLWNALNPALMDALKIIAIILGALLMAALWAVISVLNILIQVFSGIVSAISNVIGWIANIISWFGNFVGVVWNAIVSVKNIIASLPQAVRDVVGLVGSIFGQIPQKIKDAFGNAYNMLYDFGKWVLWGLKDGILSVIGSIKDVAGNIGNAIKDKVKGILGIHSPSKVFREIGQNVTQGFVDGVQGSIYQAANAMNGFNNAIMSPSMSINAQAAGDATAPTGNTTKFGDTVVNIGQVNNQQDEDWVLRRMDRNQQLATMGLSTR